MAIDWEQVVKDAAGYFSDNASTIAAGGLGAGGLALALRGYEDIGDIGQQAYESMSGYTTESGEYVPGLADKLSGMLEFQPYTVTSATGGQFGMTQDPVTGQMTYQLATSPEEQLLQQEQLKRAETLFGRAMADPSTREQEVLRRMEDLASPERQRQRLALEQRLAAQGRLGTRTGMFGGTPEALALERGIAEAQNKAALDAMQFTAQEQQRQAQMGSGMLAAGYVPQAQLLNALQPGMTAAERQRQATSEQAGAYGQTYTSGLEALLQAGLGQANIAGGVGGRIASAALGGLFS
jgi:hypothetical protein